MAYLKIRIAPLITLLVMGLLVAASCFYGCLAYEFQKKYQKLQNENNELQLKVEHFPEPVIETHSALKATEISPGVTEHQEIYFNVIVTDNEGRVAFRDKDGNIFYHKF